MSNKIIFKARNKDEYELHIKPYPTASKLPKWWTDQTPYTKSQDNPDGKKILIYDRNVNTTFKKCVPMLDAITSGYTVALWADVLVTNENGVPSISWRTDRNIFEFHSINAMDIEPPAGYSNYVFKYLNTWIPITPKGYSCLVTEPLGHRNLPFHAVPGIIDSDKSQLEIVPPMWIKKNFEGVIEKGTPLFQILPFKRENWQSTTEYYENGQYRLNQEKHFNSNLINNYIRNHWSKKTYK